MTTEIVDAEKRGPTPRNTKETIQRANDFSNDQQEESMRSVSTTKKHSSKVAAVAMATAAVASATRDFSAFMSHPSTPTRTPSTDRWNVVTPLPATPKKKKSAIAGRKRKTPSQNNTPRTESFGPITYSTYKSHGRQVDPTVEPIPVHTLILGTHPGVQSLEKQQYYGHPMNAFWWIAGDCLGFRRGPGLTKAGRPYKFSSDLRYGVDATVEKYEDQLEIMTRHGFALWDVVQSCQRPGSLDSDISGDQPNAIREFCQENPTVRRIVLANGSSGFKFFQRHFKTWIKSADLHVCSKDECEEQFQKQQEDLGPTRPIFLISALAVSPAAATYSYAEKRDFWDKFVYQPGLKDHRSWHASRSSS